MKKVKLIFLASELAVLWTRPLSLSKGRRISED